MSKEIDKLTLIVYDFDWSMIDVDSDHFLMQINPIVYDEFKSLSFQRKFQFTDLMDHLFGRLYLLGHTRSEIEHQISLLPFHPAMRQALHLAHNHPHTHISILSDANTITISHFLRVNNLQDKISNIVSNIGRWDGDRLRVERYVDREKVHGCKLMVNGLGGVCGVNLCKGKELTRLREGYVRIVYIGDGLNDFCPTISLTEKDVVLVRRGKKLEQLLKNQSVMDMVQARVIYWEDAQDVLEYFHFLLIREGEKV